MIRKRAWIFLVTCSLLLLLIACHERKESPSLEAENRLGPEHYFSLEVGEKEIEVQLAVSQSEMQRGLMHRKTLGPHQGMLFIYQRPQRMSFWMRHTSIPLDIGFFDREGVLREVYPLYPHDENAVLSRQENLQYALEMNRGWFSGYGIKPNLARLNLEAIKDALNSRGFDLQDYRTP